MRVTIVSRIYRPEPAAASFSLGAVADALLDAGHDVTVLTAAAPKHLRGQAVRENVRGFPVLRDREGYVRGYLPYLSFDIPLAFRLLWTQRPDVVLVEPPPTTGLVVRVICGVRHIPYVYDAADIWSDAANMATGSSLVVRVVRAMEVFALRGAAAIVTISDGVASRIRELGVTTPTVVTGFGAETDAFDVLEAADRRVFLYAGSYSVWHGAEVLIDAFAELLTTNPGYTLRFIGNGTERAALMSRARALGVSENIEFLDAMSARELNTHFAHAVASLATLKPGTNYEYAFATKTYSSLAAGTPVIFAGAGPTGDFLAEANRVVRAGKVCGYAAADVAQAMRAFVQSPVELAERRAIRNWVDRNHSLRAVGQRVMDVVTSVVGERRGS